MIGWQKWLGVFSCVVLVVSCFMHWAWYPDIQTYFTGFFSQNNYYGKPGILISFFAICGTLFFLLGKTWTLRLGLIFSAINVAYAIASFFKYSSSYDGIIPEKQAGIWLMLISSMLFLVVSLLAFNNQKMELPVEDGELPK